MAPYDVDADGRTDLAIASEFSMTDTEGGGSVYWVEAPDDPTQTWTLHPIDEVPTSHRLRWGDIDGDGKNELLNLPLFGVGSSRPSTSARSSSRPTRSRATRKVRGRRRT